MSHRVRLVDVRRAWEAQDPILVELIQTLVNQSDEDLFEETIREGAPTFQKFIQEIHSRPFHQKPLEEQHQYRVEQLKLLESDDAEVPLPDRLKVHCILMELWEENGAFARECLLELIATLPLKYGPWKALKQIFKQAEQAEDTEMFGALAARFDEASSRHSGQEVSNRTLGYLARRAWRYLRKLGDTLPACYVDATVNVLAWYSDQTNWYNTWIANHIFHHQTRRYSGKSFFYTQQKNLLKNRAFAELWQRTPRPLFSLLERARSEHVREYATQALKTDFRTVLREVEPSWVARLVNVRSAKIDEFVVWILNNVPRFEQAAFRDLGLHAAVLKLFDSDSSSAQQYAAEYARTHARDLTVDHLIRLANNTSEVVRKLARDLLLARDPRKEIGLDAWGKLLETERGFSLAEEVLRKHFGAKELTPDWFIERMLSLHEECSEFAWDYLPKVHPYKSLGPEFFVKLLDRLARVPELEDHWHLEELATFACETLAEKFDLNQLDPEFLKRALIWDLTTFEVRQWIGSGKLKPDRLPTDFYKTIAFHPQWEQDAWVQQLKQSGLPWTKELRFDESLSETVLEWLGDVRMFSPQEVGFDWLMQLVQRSEPRYHDFAVETMTKAFLPADFAEKTESAQPAKQEKKKEEITVDLEKQSFLFTGKLATMTRKEAQQKVKAAGGTSASSVTAKLDYLVIGDEGSPLYGQGKKGSKQLAAEKLRDQGSEIKIISETAFLQMLSGKKREVSTGDALAGCERLWQMATDPEQKPDDPLFQFALKYLRRHHTEIGPAETERPLDPGAEIPAEFLTFDRFKPLFFDRRKRLRDFALEMARWELARWQPPIHSLVELCEAPFAEVRKFIAKALLAEDSPDHKRYRIDPDVLTPEAVYSFCESKDESTRELGLELILRHPRLRVPEEMFRLTESPDRKVRAFVVRSLWALYRQRGTTPGWKPFVPPESEKRQAKKEPRDYGNGAPQRPEQYPAEQPELREFLRRMLFEIPPSRPEKSRGDGVGIKLKLKPLPARKAKLALVETMRDLAVEDQVFAMEVAPLLREFMGSRGQSEQAACLVAVTRIHHAHPEVAASV